MNSFVRCVDCYKYELDGMQNLGLHRDDIYKEAHPSQPILANHFPIANAGQGSDRGNAEYE